MRACEPLSYGHLSIMDKSLDLIGVRFRGVPLHIHGVPIHHLYLHPSVFGDTVVPHGLLDSGLESGQSGPQDIGMWAWQHGCTGMYMLMYSRYTVEPPNNGHIGSRPFVCCREVSLSGRLTHNLVQPLSTLLLKHFSGHNLASAI